MTKFEVLYKEFQEATAALKEVLQKPKDEFMRDSAIKRFELVFDLSWKTIKAFLEEKGVECVSPLLCFREGYRQGLIAYNEAWVDMVKTRNKTVHTYDERLAEEIYKKLPDVLILFQELAEKLKIERANN